MQIDLNDKTQFTKGHVKEMLASHTDGRPWQLRVTREGIAYLSEVVGNVECNDLAFRIESWTGSGYVGLEAAADDEWVTGVYNVLVKNWATPPASYIDDY